MAEIAVFDLDGTLVDTNYQHALAWYRALRRFEFTTPVWRIHRHIGMGGDHLVEALAGSDMEREHGDDLRDAWAEEFAPMLAEITPFDGARDLLSDAKRAGVKVVLASSGKQEHVDHYLDLLEGRAVADAWTSSSDVERTKPDPDLVSVALERVGGGSAVMVGDSTWDCEAAARISVPCVALRNGGFSEEELRAAGAESVYESVSALRKDLDRVLGL